MNFARHPRIFALGIALQIFVFFPSWGQDAVSWDSGPVQRPAETDKTSQSLINNFLAVSGGKGPYEALKNVVATGMIDEAGKTKRFRLVETQDGKRKITYSWHFLGRNYQEIYSFNGVDTWSQRTQPQELPAERFVGREAAHFKTHRWLIQPMVLPVRADYVFQYQGLQKVNERPAYIVVGYGKEDERTWFYFDKEAFLLTRWGGIGTIGGVKEYLDYSASKYSKINGIFLPKKIDLLAEGKEFGTIIFEEIQTNAEINSQTFDPPPNSIPVLRQKTN
ncbi:MAG: hypothetical protein ACSHYA_17420 [Opitutaceae bacterium]